MNHCYIFYCYVIKREGGSRRLTKILRTHFLDWFFTRILDNRDLKIWGRPPCRTRPEVKMSLLRVLRMTILGWDRVQSLNRTPCFDFGVVSGTWVDFTWNFHKIALSFADFCHFCNSEHIFLLLVRLSFFHRCKEVRKR